MSEELVNVVTLECDHCGGVAVESKTGLFGEDMASKCMSCGMPGGVSIQESYDDADDADGAEAYWLSSESNEAVCDDPSCGLCKEYR